MYVRAERGEWALQLFAVRENIPYFLHQDTSMKNLPDYVLSGFMNGEHVMRHQKGLWNGIWSDMFIETTFMRHGKDLHGLVDITLQPKTVKQWALSLHACAQVLLDLEKMRDRERCKDQLTHKEELPSRIKSDQIDRSKIWKMLDTMIHPLDIMETPDELTGAISPKAVNIDDALSIETKQKIYFIDSLPDRFHQSLKKEVNSMTVTKK